MVPRAVIALSVGNPLLHWANRAHQVCAELAGALAKTVGFANVLAGGLAPLAPKIDVAFIFGSMADGTATQGSDVDILIGNEQVLEELGRTVIGPRPTAPTCYDVVHEGADP